MVLCATMSNLLAQFILPLWRGNYVSIKQIVEGLACHLCPPRLGDPTVLLNWISGGVALLTWAQIAFAFADRIDDETKRYRGPSGGRIVPLPDSDAPGTLVKPDVARRQLDAESGEPAGAGTAGTVG